MKNVLLLKAGEAAPQVRTEVGDYDQWFIRVGNDLGVRFRIVTAYLGEPLPERPRDYDGIVMTGSPMSVTDPREWMTRTGEYLRDAGAQGVPVLGVCFGHQLLSAAFGGSVERHPRGREIGLVEVALTDAGRGDFLFEGLPDRMAVLTTHEDHVTRVPPGAVVLAGNDHSPVQAIRIGDHVRGVQFHPELFPEAMRSMIQRRAEGLEAEAERFGEQPGHRVPRLLAGVRETPFASRVLRNFLRR